MGDVILQVEHLCKNFGPTQANKDVSISIRRGEVRGLAGENGCGKSTLASIICGIQPRTGGEIRKDGEPYAPTSPLEAGSRYRVAMVVQELGIIPSLSGVANIFIGKTKQFSKGGFVNMRAMERAAMDIFDRWGLGKVPLGVMAGTLSVEQRKILELARALTNDPDLLILDEITQALSHDTKQVVYDLKDRFRKENRSILIITHDLEETVDICDTVTVMRDGEVVDTVNARDITVDSLKQMMIGRKVEGDYYRIDHEPDFGGQVVLEVRNLCSLDGAVDGVSFDLHQGEILAAVGLSGSGIHELGEALFGVRHKTGSVRHVGSTTHLATPQDVIKTNGAYLSKNRDEDGLMLNATIHQNLYIPSARRLAGPLGFLSAKRLRKLSQGVFEAFDIRAQSLSQPVGRLSGGNKQKVNLGRWLGQELEYVILDCPTRGVDVGVKAYIYDVLRKLKEKRVSVIMISDELTEALGMADRILVMKNGKQAALVDRGPDFTESALIEVMA
ncbi:MAG: sugar ABC transporter ATP-binding protein [Lachnospiraceae bacterium]|jgi:ribose transport system ATP-binding protein|nr:sugar ABC transporter ATP-binding protein [Lachnospiraceae bacterium]